MFQKCKNTTISDINKFNDLIDNMRLKNQGFKLQKMHLPSDANFEFNFNPILMELTSFAKKTTETYSHIQNDTFISNLLKNNFILPTTLPQVEFTDSQLIFHPNSSLAKCKHSIQFLSESILHEGYLISSIENILYLYGPNLKLIQSKNIATIGTISSSISSLAISPYLDMAIITSENIIVIMDSSLNTLMTLKLPAQNQLDTKKHYDELTLRTGASKEEIKTAFIEQVQINFALNQYKDPFAEPKLQKLIQAYTILTDQDISSAFPNIENGEGWMKTLYGHIIKQKNDFFSPKENEHRDTVCYTHFSENTAEIYLCCTSGKIYRINPAGIVKTIYNLPANLLAKDTSTRPILFMMQKGDYIHILTPENLIIILGNSTVNIIELNPKKIMWFIDGFIIKEDLSTLSIYLNNGELFDRLKMRDPIILYALDQRHLFVDTPSKMYAFKLKLH